jgi:hypothetical protein
MLSINKNNFFEIFPDWSKDIYRENGKNKFQELNSMTNEPEIINHFLSNITHNIKYSVLPSDFSIDIYKYFNFDLLTLTDKQLIKHYIQIGKKENRIATVNDFYKVVPEFDRLFYISLYGDLKKLSAVNLIKHYIYFGKSENRYIGPLDFFKKNPKFNNKITNNDFLVNYIINNLKTTKEKLSKIKEIFTEDEFYDVFPEWNCDIYLSFNAVQNNVFQTTKQYYTINYMNDFINKLKQNLNPLLSNQSSNSDKKIIYSLETFYESFSDFNYNKYRHENYNKLIGLNEINVILNWYKNKYQNEQNDDLLFNLINVDEFINDNAEILKLKQYDEILIYTNETFNQNNHTSTVLYNLGNILDYYGIKTRIYSNKKNKQNNVFNNFYYGHFNLEKTMVIYSEEIIGNPLNAPHVTRLVINSLGEKTPLNIYHSWGKKDLIYYLKPTEKFDVEHIKVGKIYKILPLMHIDQELLFVYDLIPFEERNEYCFLKNNFNSDNITKYIHSSNSTEIHLNMDIQQIIKIFKTHKYFVAYGDYSFHQITAILSGCVCIVYPNDDISKNEWIKQTPYYFYINEFNKNNIYGVAYGIEELQNAKITINFAKSQLIEINGYYKKVCVDTIINDINNNMSLNTVENNFYW